MELVKALLVFFVLTGCAEVASELPLSGPHPFTRPSAAVDNAARLGPPEPRGASARHVDRSAARATQAAVY